MDTITLHNGQVIQGEIIEFTRTYRKIRIRYIEEGSPKYKDKRIYNKNIASIGSLAIGDWEWINIL